MNNKPKEIHDKREIIEMYRNGIIRTKIARKLNHGASYINRALIGEKRMITCKECNERKPVYGNNRSGSTYCSLRCRQRAGWALSKIAFRYRLTRLRKGILDFLGGSCFACGIKDERVLQVNHIKGGGGREYRKKNHRTVWREILDGKRNGEFNLLCANCNILYEHHEGRRGRLSATL